MRGFVVLAAALLASTPSGAQEYAAFLKVTRAGEAPFDLALRCAGAPVCRGTYEASVPRPGCSRPFVLADDVTLTGMVASPGGSASLGQGRITLAGLDFTHVARPDGSCAFGTFRDLDGPYARSPSGLLTATLVDGSGRTVTANQYFAYIEPPAGEPAIDLEPVKTRIDGATASATVRVGFAAADVGTVSNLYVFALAPLGLVAGAAAKDDGSPCTLAQLDPATNRLVGTPVAGLDPLLTGVLSAQGQAVAVLANVPTAAVAGATFFVGHGADPAGMVSQWTHRFAVAVPGATSCPAEIAAAPGPLSGLWWNRAESGWGIHFTQRRNVVFAAWFGYEATGRPKWHVASGCTMPSAGMTAGTCTGTLYEVNGPTFFGVPFPPLAPGQVRPSGNLRVDFADAGRATMTMTVGGTTRRVDLVRQEFASLPATPPAVDYTDLWWNPDEAGWGLAVTHRGAVMFLAWYVYDAAGRPMWYVSSGCAVAADGRGCAGTLYRTTGPPHGTAFDPSRVQVFAAGTVRLTFFGPNEARLEYTVDGVTDWKVVTRQVF